MYDSSNLVRKFHDDHINLSREQRQDMQSRRDTNIKRLETGLVELKKPAIVDTINQGGNAMQTMTQQPEADGESRYDIDLGVVFEDADALTPATTKSWVRDAIVLKATSLKSEPEAKKKCVRVVYSEGYQCDFPVFKRTKNGDAFTYKIAIGSDWIGSDPKSINKWFEDQVKDRSPEKSSDFQLRRIARMLKYFGKVHAHRTGLKYPAGIVATGLAVECYCPCEDRDDEAFYRTLKAIENRSEYSSVFANGVVVSDDKDRERIKRLKAAAADAVAALSFMESGSDLKDEDVRKAWKKVFRHSFFDTDDAKRALSALAFKGRSSAAIISGVTATEKAQRVEAAVARTSSQGTPNRPWAD